MHDTEIRNHLHAVFDATGIGYVDEVTFGDRRIDMAAMLDGVLTGIEIKSAQDSLKRLPGQKRRFRSRFRHLVMVTEQKHLAGVLAGLPPWWGIWVADDADDVVTLEYLRAPRDPDKAKIYLLAQALWVAELEKELGLDLRLAAQAGARRSAGRAGSRASRSGAARSRPSTQIGIAVGMLSSVLGYSIVTGGKQT